MQVDIRGTDAKDGSDYKTDSINGSRYDLILQILLDSFCKTVGGADPGKSCVFPFTTSPDLVTRTECTTYGTTPDDPNPWCSTLTDENGTHVGGQGKWGYCAPKCHGNDLQFCTCDMLTGSLLFAHLLKI